MPSALESKHTSVGVTLALTLALAVGLSLAPLPEAWRPIPSLARGPVGPQLLALVTTSSAASKRKAVGVAPDGEANAPQVPVLPEEDAPEVADVAVDTDAGPPSRCPRWPPPTRWASRASRPPCTSGPCGSRRCARRWRRGRWTSSPAAGAWAPAGARRVGSRPSSRRSGRCTRAPAPRPCAWSTWATRSSRRTTSRTWCASGCRTDTARAARASSTSTGPRARDGACARARRPRAGSSPASSTARRPRTGCRSRAWPSPRAPPAPRTCASPPTRRAPRSSSSSPSREAAPCRCSWTASPCRRCRRAGRPRRWPSRG